MKLLNILAIAAVCFCTTSCMDDGWDAPDMSLPVYGNNEIAETNVITIADLKTKFKDAVKDYNFSDEITEDLQIKAYVTGNDIEGNIYKQIAIEDETGAILVGVRQSSLYTYLPVGQEILIDLKGLRVGAYASQPQIGVRYFNTNKNQYQIGQIDDIVTWQKHVKIIANSFKKDLQPADFMAIKGDVALTGARLIYIKGASVTGEGTQTLAPEDGSVEPTPSTGNQINRKIFVNGKQVAILRTSTYADFASLPLPAAGETVDLVGIATRFGSDWQILLRTAKDYTIVKPAEAEQTSE